MAERPKDEAGSPMGWRAHLIKSAIVEALQKLWGSGNSRRDSILDNYEWADNRDTDILITSNSKKNLPEGYDLKFAVKQGETAFQNLSQADYMGKNSEGKKQVGFGATTQFVIHSIGVTEVFSTMAAEETSIRMKENRHNIEDINDLNEFDIKGSSAPQSVRDDNNPPYVCNIPVEVTVVHGAVTG